MGIWRYHDQMGKPQNRRNRNFWDPLEINTKPGLVDIHIYNMYIICTYTYNHIHNTYLFLFYVYTVYIDTNIIQYHVVVSCNLLFFSESLIPLIMFGLIPRLEKPRPPKPGALREDAHIFMRRSTGHG